MKLTILILLTFSLAASSITTTSLSAGGNSRCRLVELFPGYPGYSGQVTGVDGIGDHACLEDLEEEDPDFSRRAEDRANRDAAEALGINGRPSVWTWENWMSIEDYRGLRMTCYTCLFDPDNTRREPRNHDIDDDDPRLLAGAFGSTLIWSSLVAKHGLGQNIAPWQDYTFRAIAYAANPGRHLNADELASAYEEIFIGFMTPGQWIDSQRLWCNTLSQGGYAPTPMSATAPDQYWLVTFSLNTFRSESSTGSNPIFADMTRASGLFSMPDDWYAAYNAGTTDLSLAQYIYNYGLTGC